MTNDQNQGASLSRLQEPLPAIVVDVREPGGLEAAVHDALGAAGLGQEIVAIFLVPLGVTAPSWSTVVSQSRPSEVVEDLVIDPSAHEVLLRGQAVQLTMKEFALLRYLYERRGAVITREKLLRDVWGEGYRGGARTVDVHVRRLRAKLGADWFETTRGVGYKFRRRR
jgi:DNA-binding response OmpR family regulator